jgi:peptidoglycan-associated lipoprotein
MNYSLGRRTLILTVLFAGAVVLTGCPKKPALTVGTGPGSGPGPTVSGTPGAGLAGPGQPGSVSGTPPSAIGGVGPGPGAGSSGFGGGSSVGAGGAPGGSSPGATGPGPTALGDGTQATGTTLPALPPPKEFVETSALQDIHFDFDRYEIRPHDVQILGENAQWLKVNPSALLLIEGHADERGTNEYNLALGERRAKATRDHLVSLGIAGARITVISYGEERPLCSERTEACWAQNRRAHFLVKAG